MTDAELLAEAVARAAACGKTEGGEAEGWKESLDRVLQRLRAAERDVAVLKKNDQDARDMRYSTTIERDLEMQKVVDGIKARAAVNEAIVRDLAAAKVVQGIYNGGHDVETCALCGETGEYEDDVNLIGLRLDHKSTCPYRRAVETTKP